MLFLMHATDEELAKRAVQQGLLTFKVEVQKTWRHRWRTWLALALVRLAAWVFYGIGIEMEDKDASSGGT